ncbi:MAG: hypothetical protein HY725_12390 [Candidatus Rokubacteria bacterium]|nr:hypothetical protein [Candidatus Rokubacteria bacterium]
MSKRLLVLNLALVTAAVVFAVQLIRIVTFSPRLPAAPVIRAPHAVLPPTEETPRPPASLATYDAVAARNLFNPSRSETTTVTAAAPAAKLYLHGIVLTDGSPMAFLEDPATKKVFGYKPGDAVAGGQLERIAADRVVIRRGEATFEVLLRDPAKPKPVAAAPAAPRPGVPGLQPGTPGARGAQVPPTPTGVPSPTLFPRPPASAVPPVRIAPSR